MLALAPDEVVVNVQGDEPLIPPAVIDAVADLLESSPDCAMATAAHPILDAAEFFNPNVVKVVTDRRGQALYFSRAPIPWARDAFDSDRTTLPSTLGARRHVGLYAYRVGFLAQFPQVAPGPARGTRTARTTAGAGPRPSDRRARPARAPCPRASTRRPTSSRCVPCSPRGDRLRRLD